MTISSDAASESATSGATALVKRGAVSWAYLTLLAFVVTIESVIIGMMIPIGFPWNLILFVVIAGVTGRLFLVSEMVRGKLADFAKLYEDGPGKVS